MPIPIRYTRATSARGCSAPCNDQADIPAGDGIKTGFDNEKLPVAHDACVAKSSLEPCASKKHSPMDLDAMGFDGVPWDGQCVPRMLHVLPRY